MQLPVQGFSSMVEQMAAAVQGAVEQLLDLSIGSVLRAILEASASVALWLQWLILQVLAMTRATTSTGPDLDSWMADFSFVRLPGATASGDLTFARYSIGIATLIPAGTIARTNDGSQNFVVTEDPGNPAWNGGTGYVVPASIAAVTVPAIATVSGSAGNVLAGAIGMMASPIPGIDIVTNTAAFVGGLDAEADAAFRARFVLYINSLSKATTTSIEYALASLQLGLRYAVQENLDTAGNYDPGNFCVTVDDGSGFPPAALLLTASNAVNAVRPIGSRFSISAPTVLTVSIVMSLVTSNAATVGAVIAATQSAIMAWVATLPMGGTLAISKLDALAHATDASVISVSGTMINGLAQDVSAGPKGVILVSTVVVT